MMKAIIATLVLLAALTGCSKPITGITGESALSGEVISAQNLFARPHDFVGKTVRTYLKSVDASYLLAATRPGYFYVSTLDSAISRSSVDLRVTPDAAKAWKGAGFSQQTWYTMTFSGTLIDDSLLGVSHFYFDITGFNVNSEDEGVMEQHDLDIVNGLPSNILPLPLPIKITDTKQLALLPSEYKGKSLKLKISFTKDNLKPRSDGMAIIESDDLVVLLKPAEIKEIVDKLDFLNTAWITGKLVVDKNAQSKPTFEASAITLTRY